MTFHLTRTLWSCKTRAAAESERVAEQERVAKLEYFLTLDPPHFLDLPHAPIPPHERAHCALRNEHTSRDWHFISIVDSVLQMPHLCKQHKAHQRCDHQECMCMPYTFHSLLRILRQKEDCALLGICRRKQDCHLWCHPQGLSSGSSEGGLLACVFSHEDTR
jgi:hypothetical protein